ncbi:MAG: toprim protein [Chlamydiales bacterium]|jgi:DNA primase catalytic core|nr:toprim protein [Chlamydiales bacterium]
MADFINKIIDEIKARIPLLILLNSQGIALTKQGKDYVGHCPFHEDRTPSLVISPEKNLWHCMGACQTGGSLIDWVMKVQGVSFKHAVQILKNQYLLSEVNLVKSSTAEILSSDISTNLTDSQLMQSVIDYYHATLKESSKALTYLEKRGLSDAELIDTFKIGYANRTLGYRIPDKNRKEGQLMRKQLQRIGILRPSGHEHFNGSLVVPIFDENNLIIEVYGRKTHNNLRSGTIYHLYLPGPHRGIFNLKAVRSSQEIILCELIIDAMTFWVAGLHNVTASYGVEGFTADHLRAFKAHAVERVYIAYSRDEAGDRAAAQLAEKLSKEGMECFRILFPQGMDANQYYLEEQNPQCLHELIHNAEWLCSRDKTELMASNLEEAAKEIEMTAAVPYTPIDVENKEHEIIIK